MVMMMDSILENQTVMIALIKRSMNTKETIQIEEDILPNPIKTPQELDIINDKISDDPVYKKNLVIDWISTFCNYISINQ